MQCQGSWYKKQGMQNAHKGSTRDLEYDSEGVSRTRQTLSYQDKDTMSSLEPWGKIQGSELDKNHLN